MMTNLGKHVHKAFHAGECLVKNIMLIGLLPLIFGCAGFNAKAIDQTTLKNRTLSLVIHESPDFLAITPDKNMLTMTGFDAADTAGNQLLKETGIHDPATKICKMLAKSFNADYGLLYNENSIIKAKAKATKDLVRLANGRDYLLDVKTIGWLFSYQVSSPSDYYVQYIVKTRLIDVAKEKSVGQSSCKYDTANAGKPLVRYEKLVENDAAYIKQVLKDASSFCVEKFKTELFE